VGRVRLGVSLRGAPCYARGFTDADWRNVSGSFDLIAGASESTRAKTAETFLELLGARVRNPNTEISVENRGRIKRFSARSATESRVVPQLM
jgi:hypothetical protein